MKIVVHQDASLLIRLNVQHFAQRRSLNARAPKRTHGIDSFLPHHHIARLHVRDVCAGANLHTQLRQLIDRALLQLWRIGAEYLWRAFQNQHLRGCRIDMAKITRHVKPRNVGDRARKLDPRGSAADHYKVQRRMRAGFERLPLRELKRQQHAASYLRRIFNCLQPGSNLRPVIMAEVRMRRSGGNDQVVILELGAGLQLYAPRSCIEADRLIHQHVNVFVIAKNRPDGLRNIRRGKHGKRDLVEQRLKGVVVPPVDNRHIHRERRQPLRGVDTAKAGTQHDYALARSTFCELLCGH